jgi:hypothetical protein
MRPRGELAEALSTAASRGPAPVRELAARAQVGYAAARYTASRMVQRGELVLLDDVRPALLALPLPDEGGQVPVAGELRSFWDTTDDDGA